MEDNRHQDFSPSTLYRYNRAQKNKQLPLYLQFKKEYEVTHLSYRISSISLKLIPLNPSTNTASVVAIKQGILS